MGSKKHKKHKSERRERYEDIGFSLERPPSLKLILKVSGNNSTPEYGNDSPSYDIQHNNNNENLVEYINTAEYVERRKKSKKKKKKKDREKKRKHKRMKYNDDSSQEDASANEDTPQLHDTIIRYTGMTTTNCLSSTPVTRAIQPLKPREQSYSEERHFSQSPPQSTTVVPASTSTISPQSASKVYTQHLTVPIGGGGGHFSGGETSSPSISKELSPVNSLKSIDNIKSPASSSGGGGGDGSVTREPRTCVLKLKQSKTPLSKLLDHLLRSLEKKDPHQFFAWPVTDDIAPGYSSIISEPMDFLSIRQKVDENQYGTLPEFIDDFKLMCENAIKYNHSDTVYHKAAKRLLHIGGRMLQPESLIRSLRPLMMYLKELNSRELGFVLEHHHENQENENHIVDSADEGMSTGAEELGGHGGSGAGGSLMDDTTREIKNENLPETKFEPFVDDLTPEEILQQVQNAAKLARNRMTNERQRVRKMGFLRQKKDGTTSMKILVNVDNDLPERIVSLGKFTGKLQQGTGLLQGFREDRRNNAKIVKPLNYGQFCSYAPVFDSRFSNLSKEETELILNTYGDDNCTDYAESIMEFTRDSSYAYTLANRLLDVLTNGEHSKTISQLIENQHQRYDQSEIDKLFPQTTIDTNETNQLTSNGGNKSNVNNNHQEFDSSKIDFESLKSLNELGVDVSFLQPLEQNFRLSELHRKLEKQLHTNSTLIERLQQVQTERLSQPLPQHLSYVAHPNPHEIELAVQITTNLTEMAKQLPPESISTQHALRKAMGLSDVGLPPIVHSRLNLNSILIANGCTPINEETINLDMDTTPVQMDLETEPICSTDNHNVRESSAASSSSSQVDLENELREFLEGGGTNLHHGGDDVGIEQMLLG